MNKTKRSISILLCSLVVACLFTPTVFAQESRMQSPKRVVKVAYPEQKYLTEIDDNGNYYGYSYEYLNKIAEFANWKLEYITYPNVSLNEQILSGISDIEEGEADLIGVILRSEDMEEKYLYPEQNYGMVYTTLDVLDTNFKISATSYLQMDTLRVAVLKTAKTRNAELAEFADAMKLNCEYVYCDNVDEQIEALKTGAADAMLKVSLTFLPGLKQIAEFAPRPYYFAASKGNEELIAELDEAIKKIHITDPYFESRLSSKYFVYTMEDFSLTEAETEYVARNPKLKVLLFPQYAPFAFANKDGELCGISVSILNEIGKITGIEFEYKIADKNRDATEQIAEGYYNVIIGPPHSNNFAESNGLVLSQPYLDVNLTMYINEESAGKPKTECVLALTRDVAEPIGYEYKEIRYYDNLEQCLNAVNKGEADYSYATRYMLDYYTSENSHRNLIYLNLSGYNREIGFLVPNTEECELLSMINKYVRSIPQKDIHSHLSQALAQKNLGGIRELIDNNPIIVVVVLVIILFLLMLTVMLAIYSHSNKKRNEKLQLAYTAKSDFLSRMSHDMRTPMNGIIGLTGLSLELDDLPPELEDNLSKIDESAHFLLSLINDTLDMNKIESNKIILNKEPTNLNAFFNQMVSVVQVSAKQKNVKLIAVTSEEIVPMVNLDKVRVQQIFFNLASNAIKFTPENGTVEINGTYMLWGDSQVRTKLVIKDTGIGIDKDFQSKIFEPFEQENDSTTTNYSGTGLGLAIVKNLVNIMGGSISVKSEKGHGSEFTVELIFDVAPPQANPSTKFSGHEASLEGKRVLLCEDHPLNAQIAIKLLEKKGVLAECAENGRLAVELFQQAKPGYYDAILMDIRMPVMDGIAATKAIRSLDKADAKTIPIIAMTANAFDEDVKKSLDAGMNAHLAKPIEPKLMYLTLAEQIAAAQDAQ